MAAEWKALSEEEKAGFEAKAVEDKERYAKECEEAGIEVKPPKEKAEKAEKVEKAAPKEKEAKPKLIKMTKPPKEARGVHSWYIKAKLVEFAEAHSDMGTEEVKAALIAQYDALDESAQAPFADKAREDAERFAAEQAGWEAFKAKAKGAATKAKAPKAGASSKEAEPANEEEA